MQELGNALAEIKTIEDIRKKLHEINEHIKKEENSLKFQHRIEPDLVQPTTNKPTTTAAIFISFSIADYCTEQ
jgi:hypothetical protein